MRKKQIQKQIVNKLSLKFNDKSSEKEARLQKVPREPMLLMQALGPAKWPRRSKQEKSMHGTHSFFIQKLSVVSYVRCRKYKDKLPVYMEFVVQEGLGGYR